MPCSLSVGDRRLLTVSVKLKPPNNHSFPWRPTCITVPEFLFWLLERARVELGVHDDGEESLRKCNREGRCSSSVDAEVGEEVGVKLEFERLNCRLRLRERDERMRVKRVGSEVMGEYRGRGEPGEEDAALEAGDRGW